MDLSPTDLQLVPFDLYRTDEKYDFKLTNILRRRCRPVLLVLSASGELIYSCLPDRSPVDDGLASAITTTLIDRVLREARCLLGKEEDGLGGVMRRVVISKPDSKCALFVMDKKFWCLRIFALDGHESGTSSRYAALVEPIGELNTNSLDLQKVKGLFRLSKRETDVVAELVAGRTDKEIARQLGISVETVRAYLKSVRAKLGVSTRTAIVSAVHNLDDATGRVALAGSAM